MTDWHQTDIKRNKKLSLIRGSWCSWSSSIRLKPVTADDIYLLSSRALSDLSSSFTSPMCSRSISSGPCNTVTFHLITNWNQQTENHTTQPVLASSPSSESHDSDEAVLLLACHCCLQRDYGRDTSIHYPLQWQCKSGRSCYSRVATS